MRETGIIRRIDDLGRLVVPREIRRNLCITENDPFELCYDDNGVYFRKYRPENNLQPYLAAIRKILDDGVGDLSDADLEAVRRTMRGIQTHLDRTSKKGE